jgi:hypothetical protein
MNRKQIEEYLVLLKKKDNIRLYTPFKYFDGLHTKKEIKSRFLEMLNKDYKPFHTDIGKKTSPSQYTTEFKKRYGEHITSLKQKSQVTGVPLNIITKIYNKGKAAWRTGHRVGATQSQWGHARVNSFLTFGCTLFTADFYLVEEVLARMTPSKRKKWLSCKITCKEYRSKKTFTPFLQLKKKYIKKN